jgi:hypothetical protein
MADGQGIVRTKTVAKLTETSKPSRVDDDEVLDWDFALENPPLPRRSGCIEVTLRKVQTGPSLD